MCFSALANVSVDVVVLRLTNQHLTSVIERRATSEPQSETDIGFVPVAYFRPRAELFVCDWLKEIVSVLLSKGMFGTAHRTD